MSLMNFSMLSLVRNSVNIVIFDLVHMGSVKMFELFVFTHDSLYKSENSMCAWPHLSSVSVTFKNYSLMTGISKLSCPKCLEGVTDS